MRGHKTPHTCMNCLNGNHFRCEDRVSCTCTSCLKRRGAVRPAAKTMTTKKRKEKTERPAPPVPAHPALPQKRVPRPERPLSKSPKAAYMRKYRDDIKNNPNRRRYNKWTPEKIREMERLRDSGVKVSEIARRYKTDRSHVYRLLKRARINGTPDNNKESP